MYIYTHMNIILEEQVNKERLEKVLKCGNIPFRRSDDPKWRDDFLILLKKYNKKIRNNIVKVEYVQKNKFGRYMANNGLQGFQRDVRKYISGEYVRDFDFQNCHPNILQQLFEKHGLYCGDFLKNYNENRNEVMEKYNINDKQILIKVINNENQPLGEHFRELHNNIYNKLIKELLKNDKNKQLLSRVKRERKKNGKDYNHNGGFISQYLQNIENSMLMSFYSYLTENFIKVHSLMFDGCTIDKQSNFNIEEAEERIYKDTEYKIKIVEKSVNTDWEPIEIEKVKLYEQNEYQTEKFDIGIRNKLYEKCLKEDNENEVSELIEYLNNFICRVYYPMSYGFRLRKNERYDLRNTTSISEAIGECFNLWKKNEKSLSYDKFVFQVDESKVKPDEYNLYIRPKWKDCSEDEFKQRCPKLIDFLTRIISSNDIDVYNYLINYISKMVQVGSTKQAIVLMGMMGIGKTVFCDVLKLIIEEVENDYSKNVNDINEIMTRFNSIDTMCILTTVEEVVSKAGEYHSIMNKLKDLITNDRIKIEKKGVDSYMMPSNNNYIFISNNDNPINPTMYNRRYLILRVNPIERNNEIYFKELMEEIKNNIEYIRGYFYKYKYVNNLNKIRPRTEEEEDLIMLNMSSEDMFIQDYLEELLNNGEELTLNYIYNEYEQYCRENQKKIQKKEYFSKRLKNNGYITKQVMINGIRERIVKK